MDLQTSENFTLESRPSVTNPTKKLFRFLIFAVKLVCWLHVEKKSIIIK